MSAQSTGRQLTFDDMDLQAGSGADVIHDDRTLEPAATCTHCPADAVQEGLCRGHLLEYRNELCGDG